MRFKYQNVKTGAEFESNCEISAPNLIKMGAEAPIIAKAEPEPEPEAEVKPEPKAKKETKAKTQPKAKTTTKAQKKSTTKRGAKK